MLKRVPRREQRQTREEAVDERNLQLVSIRNLDAQQVRILDVEPTASASLRASRVQPIVGQLANTIDIRSKIAERFTRWIENADARIGEKLGLYARRRLSSALQRSVGRTERSQASRKPTTKSGRFTIANSAKSSGLE